MKKYVEHARSLRPGLTERACEIIGDEYSQLRSHNMEGTDVAKTQPVTARSLETLIRIATAHAKARLSTKVEAKDAEFAVGLVHFAYFKRVLEKEKRKRGEEEEEDSEEEEEEEEEVEEEAEPAAKRGRVVASAEEEEEAAEVDSVMVSSFTSKLSDLFKSGASQLPMSEVLRAVVQDAKICSRAQALKCVEVMAEQNKVMLSGDVLYRI